MQSLVHEKYESIINGSNREGDESLPARSFFCIEIQCGGTSPNFYWLVMCVGFKNHWFALCLFLESVQHVGAFLIIPKTKQEFKEILLLIIKTGFSLALFFHLCGSFLTVSQGDQHFESSVSATDAAFVLFCFYTPGKPT